MTLKEARLSKGYTQKQLAELTSIPFRTIQDLESDKVMHISTTRADYLFRLSKALNVEMEELVNMKEYLVMQGSMTKNGGGDISVVKRCYNMAEAKEYFDRIKEDSNGWSGNPSYIVTQIECDGEIIEYYECEL